MLPFDDDAEQLFRSIEHGWTLGDRVTPDAIDLQDTSCNRERVAPDPLAAINLEQRPRENGVASITVGKSRGTVPREKGEPWEFYPEHCPEQGNDAHSEIRVRRLGSPNATDKISSAKQKLEVKTAIANRMKVAIPPTPSGSTPHEGEFG